MENLENNKVIDFLKDNRILSTVLDNLYSAVFVLDQDNKIILYNRRFLRLFGVEKNNTTERINSEEWSKWELFDENMKKLTFDENPIRKATTTGIRIKNQLTGLKSNGNIVWLLINIEPLYNEYCKIERIVCTFLDVTELIKSNSALKKSEQRYQTLVTASSEALYFMSHDWKEMTVLNSKGFLSETLTPDSNWLQKYIHPADQSYILAKINEAIKMKGIFELEHRVLLADGSLGWTHSRAIPMMNTKGEITEWFGAASDITNRKLVEQTLRESEEKFSALFRSNPSPIVLSKKTDGLIIDVNDSFLKLFEISREEVIGSNSISLNMFARPEDRDQIIKKLILDGRIADYEVEIRRKSGEVRTVLLFADPVKLGSIDAMITTIQDITERKNIEKTLLDNQNRLQELNATKDKLFSIISHDLRSPFTSIIGFIELLIDKVKKNDIDEILSYGIMIRESSWSVMNLLTNLIEWSKLQSFKLNIYPTKFDLPATVREVFDLMKPLAEKKAITLTTRIPANLIICADRSMISSVIRNLVSNAIKFTPQGGQILFSAYEKDKSVNFEVEDNGIGMKQSVTEKLFNNNWNISLAGTENETGTGLGLIICREFISKHEGSIRAESKIGHGSRFVVTIPQKINNKINK